MASLVVKILLLWLLFWVCPFRKHLRPNSKDRRSCCAQGEENNILLVNLFFSSIPVFAFQVTQCKSEVTEYTFSLVKK